MSDADSFSRPSTTRRLADQMLGQRRYILGCSLVLLVAGCGSEPKPRSVDEINAAREALPTLYMTASGKRIEAPRSQGVFVDKESRELAWPAYECTNPDCPGRSPDGEPHLFVWEDARLFVTPEGTLGSRKFETAQQWRDAVAEAGGDRQPTCKKCVGIRDLDAETPEEGQKYSEYPRQYKLPRTREMEKQLDAEHQERIEYINRRISGE